MNWFQIKNAVTDTEELINWNKPDGLLDTFVRRIINHRENLQIIGSSKSGKTSIMNCICHRINNLGDNKKLLCVTVNFTGWHDRVNDENGYNLISASILNAINNVDELKPREYFKLNNNKKISVRNDIAGYINNISSNKSHRSTDLFKSLVLTLAEKGFSLVILIDDYESLYFDTFNGKKGSMFPLRKLIDNVEFPLDTFFRCCVSGPKTWLDYGNRTKSIDFDFLESADYLPVFNLEESKLFINYGRDAEKLKMGSINYNMIYELSGGSPHLIKRICDSIIENKKIEEDILKEKNYPYFVSRWNELSYEQQLVIKGEDPKNDKLVKRLVKLNLIGYKNSDESEFIPKGTLWNEFVKEQDLKDQPKRDYTEVDTYRKESQVSSKARTAIRTLHAIQTNLAFKFLDPVFDTSISLNYGYYTSELGNLCHSKESLGEFLQSVYILFFESTQRYEIIVTEPEGKKLLNTLEKELIEVEEEIERNKELNKELEDSVAVLKASISQQIKTNFNFINSKINEFHKGRNKRTIWKHPNRSKFMTSKKTVFDDFSKWLEKEKVLINGKKFPINLASLPNQFNRFPLQKNLPKVVRKLDVLRHYINGAHDVLSENFIVEMNPAEAWSTYTDTFNEPQDDDFYKIQIGILKELQMFLSELYNWAQEQEHAASSRIRIPPVL